MILTEDGCNLTIYNSPLTPYNPKNVSAWYSCTFMQKMELISTLRKLQFVFPPTWASFRNFKICEEYKPTVYCVKLFWTLQFTQPP